MIYSYIYAKKGKSDVVYGPNLYMLRTRLQIIYMSSAYTYVHRIPSAATRREVVRSLSPTETKPPNMATPAWNPSKRWRTLILTIKTQNDPTHDPTNERTQPARIFANMALFSHNKTRRTARAISIVCRCVVFVRVWLNLACLACAHFLAYVVYMWVTLNLIISNYAEANALFARQVHVL